MTFPIIMIGAVLSHVAYQAAIVVKGFFALAFHFLWIRIWHLSRTSLIPSLCRTLETFEGTDRLLYGSWYNFAGEIFERRRVLC